MTTIIDTKKYISSTYLKNNTKNVLDTADDLGEVFIMNNNKPRAIIISVEQYNNYVGRKDDFKVVGDIIPMSYEDAMEIREAREEYKRGEFITEEELFKSLKS